MWSNDRFGLNLADDAKFAALQEVDDSIDFLTLRHLLLDLIDGVEDAGLTVEDEAVGIGDVT